jgi:hypothetical protein
MSVPLIEFQNVTVQGDTMLPGYRSRPTWCVRRNDPIAQAEMLRCDTGSQSGLSTQMVATYPRHEKGRSP